MKRYFYKLYKKNLNDFQKRVYLRFQAFDKRSIAKFMKSILDEVNDLFLKIGGRISNKNDIPKNGTYPDSKKFNRLITDIDYDLGKVYDAQKLIEDDINNLMNFNQMQREKSFVNFAVVQQAVYAVYVKSKRDIIGGYEIPGGSPFISSSMMSKESDNVMIDENRNVLTLSSTTEIQKPIDVSKVNIQLIPDISLEDKRLYPNNKVMYPSSHWKRSSNDPHFQNLDDSTTREEYFKMMVDDPTNPLGIGLVEFESVATPTNSIKRLTIGEDTTGVFFGLTIKKQQIDLAIPVEEIIREELSRQFHSNSRLIYLDSVNSLQSVFANSTLEFLPSIKRFKLIITFINSSATNQLTIDFSANGAGVYPIVEWENSKVYSNAIAFGFVQVDSVNDGTDGLNIGKMTSTIVPTRAEIILKYTGDTEQFWPNIKFYMSHYVYTHHYAYTLPQTGSTDFKIHVTKEYNIFVDSEANEDKEERRALDVLRGRR